MIHHFLPDVIIPAIWIVLFSYFILKRPFFKGNALSSKHLLSAFYLKLIFGFITVWIYTHVYTDRSTSDIFRYYDDGIKLFSMPGSQFARILLGIDLDDPELLQAASTLNNWGRADHFSLFNDNQFMIRLNALLCFLSFGGYVTHLIFFNFFSFVGLTAIFKVFTRYFPQKEKLIFISAFLIPSTLLWCSGILKDSLVTCCLGSSIYFFDNYFTRTSVSSRIKNLIIYFTLLFLLLLEKSQVFIMAMPAWIGVFITRGFKVKRPALVFPLILLVYFTALVNFKMIVPSADFLKTLSDKQVDFKRYAIKVKAGSYIELPTLAPNVISLIKNLPSAFVNTFTRPWLSESKNLYTMISAVEILVLLALLITVVAFPDRENFRFNPYLFFAIFYILFLFAMIGLVTPVLGAIVRYRAHAFPFLAIIICVLTDFSKIRATIALKVTRQIQPS